MVILIAAATWLVGGNIIVAAHCVRRGKPWWSCIRRPWTFSVRELGRGEGAALAALAVVCLALFSVGLSN